MNKKVILTVMGILSTLVGAVYTLLLMKITDNFEMIQALIEVHLAN